MVLLIVGAVAGAEYCRRLGYPSGRIYTVVPAPAPAATVAVFLSGDMGFNAGMGPRIAERIADGGVPVLGVNTLTAFARRQSPGEAAAFVHQAIVRALALPGAARVVVIGHSFGANIALAGLADLVPALRQRVALAVLIVPGDSMLYRATPGGVLDFGNDGPALPAARRVDWLPALCIRGESERASLCPQWVAANVRGLALPGGHFLHEDSALIAATVLRRIGALDPITKSSAAAQPAASAVAVPRHSIEKGSQ